MGNSCPCQKEDNQQDKWQVPRVDSMRDCCQNRSENATRSQRLARMRAIHEGQRRGDGIDGLHRDLLESITCRGLIYCSRLAGSRQQAVAATATRTLFGEEWSKPSVSARERICRSSSQQQVPARSILSGSAIKSSEISVRFS